MQINKWTIIWREDAVLIALVITFVTLSMLATLSWVIHGSYWLLSVAVASFFLVAAITASALLHSVAVDRKCAKCEGRTTRVPLAPSCGYIAVRELRCKECGNIQASPVQPRGWAGDRYARRAPMSQLWDLLHKDKQR